MIKKTKIVNKLSVNKQNNLKITTLCFIGLFFIITIIPQPSMININYKNLIFNNKDQTTIILSRDGYNQWWNTEWTYRKSITIDSGKINTNLTNFPLLIELSDEEIRNNAQPNGNDIVFTDINGNKLSHEIEYYHLGNLTAWVKVPHLQYDVDTILYIYYGNLTSTNQENISETWIDNYKVVQHLKETSGNHYDSTINDNDGVPNGGINQNYNGKLDGANLFDGLDDYITISADSSFDFSPNSVTIELWIQTLNNNINQVAIQHERSKIRILDGNIQSTWSGGSHLDSGIPAENNQWYQVVITYDGSNQKIYINGKQENTANFGYEDTTGFDITMSHPSIQRFQGGLDELRFSNDVKNHSWINTSFQNQNNPTSFYYVGTKEVFDAPIIFNPLPEDKAFNLSINISKIEVTINDPHGDNLNWSIQTSPFIGQNTSYNDTNGTKTCDISDINFDTLYTWYVNVTNVHNKTNTATFTFTTQKEKPLITNVIPMNGSIHVEFNPQLKATIFDAQHDEVNWFIKTNSSGQWDILNQGLLIDGNGDIYANSTNINNYSKVYFWSINVTDPQGSNTWVNNTYHFTTKPNQMNFAAFTDTHIYSSGYDTSLNLDTLAQDIMDNTMPCEFVVHLGDIVGDRTYDVELNPDYKSNFKASLVSHLNLPFEPIIGNHDTVDYWDHPEDPWKKTQAIIDVTELNSFPHAMMRNNILFISLPEDAYLMWTRPNVYEWLEYMTDLYHNTTTIIFCHQALEDTTEHDDVGNQYHRSYRGKQNISFWSTLFQNNPQLKMWIHGHQHWVSWFQGNQSTGVDLPYVYDFGHEIVVSHPYPNSQWIDRTEVDTTTIYSITETSIGVTGWENTGSGGHYVHDHDHVWNVSTTYDDSAEDWYSFPVFIQDQEIQKTDMKILSPNITLQLIGTAPMELFYDSYLETTTGRPDGKGWVGENILGFGDDTLTEVYANEPGMTVYGPADITFPPKGPASQKHEDGRSGQPYHYFPLGVSPAAVPGATYTLIMTAKSDSGNGKITMDVSVTDWGTRSQYNTLPGSITRVFDHTVGTSYETIKGNYTVPQDADAWFLQGIINFTDSATYNVSYFSIKRQQETNTSDNFSMSVSGKWYNYSGILEENQAYNFSIIPNDLCEPDGEITFTSNIDGNHYGIARIIYHAPILMSRNAQFRINDFSNESYHISLTNRLSSYADSFKILPFSNDYGPIYLTAEDGSAETFVSDNGNCWATSNIPSIGDELDLNIYLHLDKIIISNESPLNNSINIGLNPILQVDVKDIDWNDVYWEIKTNASGEWQCIKNGTLVNGAGKISATTTNINLYNTTYHWMVCAIDQNGSGKWTNASFSFRTHEYYEPGDWWNTRWNYRKEININHTEIREDLINFPFFIQINDSNLSQHTQENGNDIVFTDYYGNELHHEIENYQTGNITAWVNISRIYSEKNTILYMYYGNNSCPNQENSLNTWDDHFIMVQHLNETNGLHYDSTQFGNHGTVYGNPDQNADGIADKADAFDGIDDYIDCGNDNSLDTSEITISGWVKPYLTGDDWQRLLAKETGSNAAGGYGIYIHTDGKVFLALDGNAIESSQSIPVNEWSQIVCTTDGTSETIYINGLPIDISSNGYSPGSSSSSLRIGNSQSVTDRHFNGVIDETRISKKIRNESWIYTTYINLADQKSLYFVKSPESQPSQDNEPPAIRNVSITTSIPIDTIPGVGWENITCNVTDNQTLQHVKVNISLPTSTYQNSSMTKGHGDIFYYNTTFTDAGTYNYYIWANDFSDNTNTSILYPIDIPADWDINIDRQCSIVDLVFITGRFDEFGTNGWLREDVNNDGQVSIVDLVLVSGHFDETW